MVHLFNSTGLPSTKLVKIFIYDLPSKFNKDLIGKPHTNHEMVEYEAEVENMIRRSKFFTNQIQEATHYFIPVYGVTYCAVQKARENSFGCKRSRQFLVEAISFVRQLHPGLWTRNSGADHLIPSGYDFGVCYATFARDANKWKRPVELEQARVIGFLGVPNTPDTNPGRCYSNQDVTLPPYVPRVMRAQLTRQTSELRSNSVFLRTSSVERHPIRGKLIKAFTSYPHALVSSTPVGTEQFASEMRSSKFCLSPPGFAPWSFRLSEAVLAECIPVLPNSGAVKFPCASQVDYNSLAILINSDDTSKIKSAISAVEGDSTFMARAAMSLRVARRFFEYGDATMECLVSQL